MKPRAINLLKALATYKYVTTSQLVVLGVRSHKANLYHDLKLLKSGEKPLIGSKRYGEPSAKGRLEDIHYLLPAGKNRLVKELGMPEDAIKLPKGKVAIGHLYFHHKQTVDMEIAFRQELERLGGEVLACRRYFDGLPTRGGSRSLTSFPLSGTQFIRPDMLFFYADKNAQQHVLLIELHRGKDIQKAIDQLAQHVLLMEQGTVVDRFRLSHGYDKPYKLVFVVEHSSTLSSIKERFIHYLGTMADDYLPYVVFATLDEVSLVAV